MNGRAGTLTRTISVDVFRVEEFKKILGPLLALSFAAVIWHMTPRGPLDANGMRFLATLTAAVILWSLDVFDEYIVGLGLLLSWLLSGLVPSQVALNGFSSNAWFFVLGVFGMAAAVNTSGLLKRIALYFVRKVRPTYGSYTFALSGLGFLITPLLPTTRGRIGIFSPMTQAISDTIGLAPRSNGSAGLNLSAYVGFSQMNFLFLTGSTTSLIGWSLLPDAVKAEFGWVTWLLAALPAGILNFLLLLLAVRLLFRLDKHDQESTSSHMKEIQLERMGAFTSKEWITLAVVCLALAGWITKPFHGVSQAWVALTALIAFLITGVLEKKHIRNNIDWGFLIFFGVVYGMSGTTSHLKVDLWLRELMHPLLSAFSFHPVAFLIGVMLLVYFVRFFLFKPPTVILLSLVLGPWAEELGIHPGVLLVIMLFAMETWFFSYQQPSYQIAYSSTNEKGFTHAQGRKLMVAKFAASFIVLAITVPYWSWLGYIEAKPAVEAHVPAKQVDLTFTGENPGRGKAVAVTHTRPSREEVAAIQKLLSERGFEPGPIDGIAGPRTRAAVRQYQTKTGLPVDGKASGALASHLRMQQSLVSAEKPVFASGDR